VCLAYAVTLFALTTRCARSIVSWANCSTQAWPATSSVTAGSFSYSVLVWRFDQQDSRRRAMAGESYPLQLIHQSRGVFEDGGIFGVELLGKDLVDNPVFAYGRSENYHRRGGAPHTPVGDDGFRCLKLGGAAGALVDVDVCPPDGGGNLVSHGAADNVLIAGAAPTLVICVTVSQKQGGIRYG